VEELKINGSCLVVGWKFPWWGLVAGRLGLEMPRALLFDSSLIRSTREYFLDANVRVLESLGGILEEELLGTRVLCLERAPPEKRELEELLRKGKELECVLVSR
jgi:hypothetical protein